VPKRPRQPKDVEKTTVGDVFSIQKKKTLVANIGYFTKLKYIKLVT